MVLSRYCLLEGLGRGDTSASILYQPIASNTKQFACERFPSKYVKYVGQAVLKLRVLIWRLFWRLDASRDILGLSYLGCVPWSANQRKSSYAKLDLRCVRTIQVLAIMSGRSCVDTKSMVHGLFTQAHEVWVEHFISKSHWLLRMVNITIPTKSTFP